MRTTHTLLSLPLFGTAVVASDLLNAECLPGRILALPALTEYRDILRSSGDSKLGRDVFENCLSSQEYSAGLGGTVEHPNRHVVFVHGVLEGALPFLAFEVVADGLLRSPASPRERKLHPLEINR
jgi:hypothetical protein